MAGRQGSFAWTLFLSFALGWGGFLRAIDYFKFKGFYEHDFVSCWILAPLGAFCGFVAGTWVHELAHFFAARFVGGQVHKIQIGSGKLLGTFRILKTPCEIHESLRSGLIAYSLTSVERARTKMALIAGAAPAASLVLAGGSAALLIFMRRLDPSSDSLGHYLLPFLVGWTLTCVLFLPGVLLPYRYQFAGRAMETDAMRLLTIPRLTDAEIAKKITAARTLLGIREEIDPGTISLEQALEKAEAAPNDLPAICTAAAFLRRSEDPRVLIYYKKLVNLFPESDKRKQFLDQYLTCALEMDAVSGNSEEMEELSRELVVAHPHDASVMGTRGSVLIDLGQLEHGKAMLEEVLERTESLSDEAYINVFLALAEKREGKLELAREYAEKAAKLDSHCLALKRIADLVSPERFDRAVI